MTDELAKLGYAEVSGDGGQAALAAITRACEVKLRDRDVDGRPLFFNEIVDKILTALESRKELRIKRKDTLGSHQLIRSGLCGWDLIDFVNFDYLHKSREVPIDKSTGGNWDRIASQNPELIVLFCRDIGEIIKPNEAEKVCGSLTPLPDGRCHLIASVPCLEQLASVHGGPATTSKLTPYLYWQRPTDSKLFEECEYGIGSGCNRLQDLGKKKCIGPGPLEPHGAVIFGKNDPRCKRSCKPPKAQTPRQGATTLPALAVPVSVSILPRHAQVHGSTSRPISLYEPEDYECDFLSRKEGKKPLYPIPERTRHRHDAEVMSHAQGKQQPGNQAIAAGGSSRIS